MRAAAARSAARAPHGCRGCSPAFHRPAAWPDACVPCRPVCRLPCNLPHVPRSLTLPCAACKPRLPLQVDLNSMDVDLSEQLRVRKRSSTQASTSAPAGQAAAPPRRRPPVKFASIPPTRVEQRNWERSGKYSRKVVAATPTNEVDQVRLYLLFIVH